MNVIANAVSASLNPFYPLSETLRKYPPLPGISRECTIDYKVPGTNVVIEKGTPVMIPVWAFHYDEHIYPEPHKFQPERFSAENRKGFVEQPWLPFGEGPRRCIGSAMGRQNIKLGLITLLRKFRLELGDELQQRELKIGRKQMVPTSINGIHLKIKNRQ